MSRNISLARPDFALFNNEQSPVRRSIPSPDVPSANAKIPVATSSVRAMKDARLRK